MASMWPSTVGSFTAATPVRIRLGTPIKSIADVAALPPSNNRKDAGRCGGEDDHQQPEPRGASVGPEQRRLPPPRQPRLPPLRAAALPRWAKIPRLLAPFV